MGADDRTLSAEQADALVQALLAERGVPERVHYAAGVLLDAADFADEQAYARGRLARALAAIFGFGTVAGLKVECAAADNPERQVKVAPGLALDRLGRLIEVRREQCLRLKAWFDWQATLAEAARAKVIAAARDLADGGRGVVLDVFLRFAVCPHGKTPAFAAGPFNATDYVVPSRLADAFELSLDLAASGPGEALRAPASALPALDARVGELQALACDAAAQAALRRSWIHDSVFAAWQHPDPTDPGRLPKLPEQAEVEDWDKVLLARLPVPVTQATDTAFPALDASRPVAVDNYLRPIVFNPHRWTAI